MDAIHVLQINHRHGTDLMAFVDEYDVWRALERWAREWWCEVEDDDEPPVGMSGEDIVEQYFGHELETWEEHCIGLAPSSNEQLELPMA
jgi:hypothetical protein